MFWVGVVDRRAAMERIGCGMAMVISSSTMGAIPARCSTISGTGTSSTRHAIRQNGAGSVSHAPLPWDVYEGNSPQHYFRPVCGRVQARDAQCASHDQRGPHRLSQKDNGAELRTPRRSSRYPESATIPSQERNSTVTEDPARKCPRCGGSSKIVRVALASPMFLSRRAIIA